MSRRTSSYKLRNFVFDLLLLFITGGLWFIWIIIREVRRFQD